MKFIQLCFIKGFQLKVVVALKLEFSCSFINMQ